ncbi:hypothetical protein PENTCL1PPCAC_10494, partial [Pristionchus entomophagus]
SDMLSHSGSIGRTEQSDVQSVKIDLCFTTIPPEWLVIPMLFIHFVISFGILGYSISEGTITWLDIRSIYVLILLYGLFTVQYRLDLPLSVCSDIMTMWTIFFSFALLFLFLAILPFFSGHEKALYAVLFEAPCYVYVLISLIYFHYKTGIAIRAISEYHNKNRTTSPTRNYASCDDCCVCMEAPVNAVIYT